MAKLNDLSWTSVYSYEITKFANVRYRHFCCWFTNETWQNGNTLYLKNHVCGKDPGGPKFHPLFLSTSFTTVFQLLPHESPDPVEFRSGIHNMLEIKLSFETCDRWETEQRILAVHPYSIKRTSQVGVNKNKDTRIRKFFSICSCISKLMAASFKDYTALCFRFMFSETEQRHWYLSIHNNILISYSRVEMSKKTDSI
jgi:hypothetical protein